MQPSPLATCMAQMGQNGCFPGSIQSLYSQNPPSPFGAMPSILLLSFCRNLGTRHGVVLLTAPCCSCQERSCHCPPSLTQPQPPAPRGASRVLQCRVSHPMGNKREPPTFLPLWGAPKCIPCLCLGGWYGAEEGFWGLWGCFPALWHQMGSLCPCTCAGERTGISRKGLEHLESVGDRDSFCSIISFLRGYHLPVIAERGQLPAHSSL